jgi:hypothetical protein
MELRGGENGKAVVGAPPSSCGSESGGRSGRHCWWGRREREDLECAHASGQPLIFFSGMTVLTNGDAIVPVEILTVITSDLHLQVALPFSKANKRSVVGEFLSIHIRPTNIFSKYTLRKMEL